MIEIRKRYKYLSEKDLPTKPKLVLVVFCQAPLGNDLSSGVHRLGVSKECWLLLSNWVHWTGLFERVSIVAVGN